LIEHKSPTKGYRSLISMLSRLNKTKLIIILRMSSVYKPLQ